MSNVLTLFLVDYWMEWGTIMFSMVLSYKESNVLKAFVELAKARTFELSSKTQMAPGEIAGILGKLERKGLLNVSDHAVELTTDGQEALRMLRTQAARYSTSSQPVLLTDEATANEIQINSIRTAEDLERSIDEAVKNMRQ